MSQAIQRSNKSTCGYAAVNGLDIYYEIEGVGDPLVFIPPAFGIAGAKSFSILAQGRSIISIDMQGNGRTARPRADRLHRQRVHENIGRAAFDLIQKRPQRFQVHIKCGLKADRVRRVVALGSFSAGRNKAGALIAGQLRQI